MITEGQVTQMVDKEMHMDYVHGLWEVRSDDDLGVYYAIYEMDTNAQLLRVYDGDGGAPDKADLQRIVDSHNEAVRANC